MELGSTTTLLLFGVSIGFLLYYLEKGIKRCLVNHGNEKNYKTPPIVSGRLPIIGHGLQLNGDMLKYIRKCNEKYGEIFQLQIGRFNVAMVCDTKYASEFFNAKEEELSMYEFLYKLNFLQSYSEEMNALENIAEIIKSTIAKRFEVFLPIIEDEAEQLAARIVKKIKDGKSPDFVAEVHRYVAQTGSRSFLGIPLSDSVLEKLIHLTDVVNKVFVSTFTLPNFVTRFIFKNKVIAMREEIAREFQEQIDKYRMNKQKEECAFLRAAVDFINPKTGEPFPTLEIANMIILLFISNFESTEVGLCNSVMDMASHQGGWSKGREETEKVFKSGDFREILDTKYINACVMETARMTQLMFGLGRVPLKCKYLGDYYIGGCDMLIMAAPIVQVYGGAKQIYSNAETYNPERFLWKKREPIGPQYIQAWGAGVHHCPGRPYAMYEIKVALAHLLKNLEVEVEGKVEMDYWKFNLFAEKKGIIKFRLRDQ